MSQRQAHTAAQLMCSAVLPLAIGHVARHIMGAQKRKGNQRLQPKNFLLFLGGGVGVGGRKTTSLWGKKSELLEIENWVKRIILSGCPT